MLSGLRTQKTERVRTGLPLLGAIPVIGHLFRRTAPRTRDTELLLLVTPHIVRLPSRERFRLQTLYIARSGNFPPRAGLRQRPGVSQLQHRLSHPRSRNGPPRSRPQLNHASPTLLNHPKIKGITY